MGPNTAGSLRKAVRVYHEDGADAARASLRASLSGHFAQPGAPATKAAHARTGLETYIRLAAADPRPAFVPRGRVDVAVDLDTVAGDVDVVVLDPGGYAGRLLLFGPTPMLTSEQLELLAFAPAAALADEFDADSVVGIDVWELRRERITPIGADRALARQHDVAALLRRLQQP